MTSRTHSIALAFLEDEVREQLAAFLACTDADDCTFTELATVDLEPDESLAAGLRRVVRAASHQEAQQPLTAERGFRLLQYGILLDWLAGMADDEVPDWLTLYA